MMRSLRSPGSNVKKSSQIDLAGLPSEQGAPLNVSLKASLAEPGSASGGVTLVVKSVSVVIDVMNADVESITRLKCRRAVMSTQSPPTVTELANTSTFMALRSPLLMPVTGLLATTRPSAAQLLPFGKLQPQPISLYVFGTALRVGPKNSTPPKPPESVCDPSVRPPSCVKVKLPALAGVTVASASTAPAAIARTALTPLTLISSSSIGLTILATWPRYSRSHAISDINIFVG